MSEYVMKQLKVQKAEIAKLLAASNSQISISVDVWTPQNYMSFLGVVAHFVSTRL
jgi:hypothetical protein